MTRENEGQRYNKEMTYPDDPVPSEPCRARRSADTRWTPGTPTKAIFPIFPFLFFPKLPFRSDENTDLGEHTRTRKCQISQGDFRLCRVNISPIRFPFYLFASENARQTPPSSSIRRVWKWERFTERYALEKKEKRIIYILFFRQSNVFNF